MDDRTRKSGGEIETKSLETDGQPEAGYGEWLSAEIEAAQAELDAGKGIPADKVWKMIGLE